MLRPNVDIDAIRFFPPEWYEASGPGGAIDPAEPHSVRRVFDANMQAYYAMIEVIDDNVGRRCHMLERNGIADSTMVALLSDHGERGGSHGKLGKAEPWEESVRVPLIVSCRAPGLVPGGCACDVPVHTEDLFCNLPDLVGGSEAPAPLRVDFAPYILGRAPEPDRDGVLLEFVTETRANRAYWDSTWRGLRTRNHKYTVLGGRTDARPWQLFDLAADPCEQANLVDDPASQALAANMQRQLAAVLDQSGDDFALAPAFGLPARNAVAV